MDISRAGAALGVASAAALGVRVVGGWWLDRLSTRGNLALLGLVSVGAIGAVLMATGAPWVMVVGIVLSVCGSWSWPPPLLMKVLQRFSHAPGSASGHLQVGASIGAASARVRHRGAADLVRGRLADDRGLRGDRRRPHPSGHPTKGRSPAVSPAVAMTTGLTVC
jgi:hypothetical protein